MNCPKCQKLVGENDPFCPECGTKLILGRGFRNYLLVNLVVGSIGLFVLLGGAVIFFLASFNAIKSPPGVVAGFLVLYVSPFSVFGTTPYFLISSAINFIYARNKKSDPFTKKIMLWTIVLSVMLILSFFLQFMLFVFTHFGG